MMSRLGRIYFTSLEVLWALALIGLPLTTFPLFSASTGAIVTPFSGAPILALLVLWLLPALVLRRKQLPLEAFPIFIFVLVALLSSAAAFFIEIPTFKSATPLNQELRTFSTLAIGLAFYLVCATWAQDAPRLRKALRWVHLGGALMILWTTSQVWYILTQADSYPPWLLQIQEYLVIKPKYFFFYGNRTSGLAYEASWFGHQMAMLYFPLWLSATVQRKTAFNFKFLGISVENILLVLGLAEFMLSGPRISLLSLMLMLVALMLLFNAWVVRRITHWFTVRRRSAPTQWVRIGLPVGLTIVLLAGYLLAAAGGIVVISQRDARLQLLLSEPPTWGEISLLATLDEDTIIAIGARLAFLERVIYWLTGWQTFAEHPWLGVGLGNAGFFFPQNVPAAGWLSYEIRNVILRASSVPNIKSLWVRLLAETGILGFYAFAGWLVGLGKSAQLLRRSTDPTHQTLALAGLLALVALISEGFSIDSFAMPYLWVSAGLLSAAGMGFRKNKTSDATSTVAE